jgi:hypothetical protein
MKSQPVARITWILALLTLASCAAQPTAAPAVEPTQTQAAGAPLPPTPLPTFTPLPTTAPTATPNPPAKLTVEELDQRLDPLGSDACHLPCYGFLTVGQADLDGALEFYSRLGIGLSDLMPGDYDGVRTGSGDLHAWLNKATDQAAAEAAGYAPPLVDLTLQDGLVNQVYVGWTQMPERLDAARIAGGLGEPDTIEAAVVQDGESTTYMLRLIYSIWQADFVYYGPAAVNDAGLHQICVNQDTVQQVLFGVWEPGTGPKEGLAHSEHLQPIEELTGSSMSDLTAQLANGQCLIVSAGP